MYGKSPAEIPGPRENLMWDMAWSHVPGPVPAPILPCALLSVFSLRCVLRLTSHFFLGTPSKQWGQRGEAVGAPLTGWHNANAA